MAADLMQLSGVGDGFVADRMVNFHILNRDWMKEISFVNYTLPDPGGQAHQNHRDHYVYHPQKIADKVESADRQVNFKG